MINEISIVKSMKLIIFKLTLFPLGAIHKLRYTNFMIFDPSPVLVTGGHISETSPPNVTSHILQFYI